MSFKFEDQSSEFVYVRSYSRWIPAKNRRETWPETVQRYIDFIREERGDKLSEAMLNEVQEAILTFQVMPSMRALWAAGPAAKAENLTMYNCLMKETQFITSKGVKSFLDFSAGDDLTVLTHTGQWKSAKVVSKGVQDLNKITIMKPNGSVEHVVYATANHRWLLANKTETTDLQVGNIIMSAPHIFGDFNYDEATPDERLYWCYGYVYGDGTKVKAGSVHKYSMVRLCKKDEHYRYRFEEMGFETSASHSIDGDFIAFTGRYLKTLPDLDKEPVERVKAFVAGFLDADGSKQHNNGTTQFISIQVTGDEGIEFVKKAFPMCGVYIINEEDKTSEVTNFGPRTDHTIRFIVRDNKITGSNAAWKVVKIEAAVKREEVWCLSVEDDHSFILPQGIVTGNCSFSAIDSTASFAECLYILMCGAGFGFDVTRESVNKLPIVPPMLVGGSEVVYIEDSRESWADSIKILMNGLYDGVIVRFDYSRIRPKGARLKTMGGRASGPEPLRELHAFIIESFLHSCGRKLSSLECHDICNKIAEIVIVGGVRRSSEISLSNLDDEDMRRSKVWPFPAHRAMANNSAVYSSKPSHQDFLKEWKELEESGTGERGIFNLEAARKLVPERRDGSKIQGMNPCKPLRSTILTPNGYITFEQALQLENLKVIGSNGEIYSASKPFKTGSNREVMRVLLSNGRWLYGTPNHQHLTSDKQWKTLEEMAIGDRLDVNLTAIYKPEITDSKRYWDGVFCGWTWGDGSLQERGDSRNNFRVQWCFGDHERDVATLFEKEFGVVTKPHGQKPETCRVVTQHTAAAKRVLAEGAQLYDRGYGFRSLDKSKIEWLRGKDSNFKLGFLRALFTADGSVRKNGIAALYGTEQAVLEQCGEILNEFGIYSCVGRRGTAGIKTGPYGSRNAKENYVLEVPFSQFEKIGFLSERKNQLLIERRKTKSIRKKLICSTVSIKKIERNYSVEDVYDITVDSAHHSFVDSTVTTHNCGEILLRSREMCNLSEVVVKADDTLAILIHKVRLATILGTIQSTFTHFPYLRKEWVENCEEERLLGVSLTGIMDAPVLMTARNLKALKQAAISTAAEMAQILGINMPTAITCIKPSGTVSQLTNSASGCHPRYAKKYIRRYRISNMDPLFKMMRDQGFEFTPENGQVAETAQTWVVSYPVAAPDSAVCREAVSAIDQLELYKLLQENWSEQNTSLTVYVPEGGWDEVGRWVWDHWSIVKGVSFLPMDSGHYTQAPYEVVSDEEWQALADKQPKIDYSQLSKYEKVDNTTGAKTLACTGEKCELI